MTLVDPKLGVPYTFGEKLPSGHVNTVWAQQPNAFDAINGGTYALVNPATINGGLVTLQNASIGALTVTGSASVGGTGLLSTVALKVQAASTFGWDVAQTWQRRLNLGAAFPMVATYWSRLLVGSAIAWQQDDVAAARALFVPIPPMVNSCTITQIQVTVDGDAGSGGAHPGAWPPTLPSIGLYDAAAGVVAGTTATDGTVSWLTYEASHTIAAVFAAVTQTPTDELYVVIYGETGATSQASSLAVTKVQVFGSIQDLKPLS